MFRQEKKRAIAGDTARLLKCLSVWCVCVCACMCLRVMYVGDTDL